MNIDDNYANKLKRKGALNFINHNLYRAKSKLNNRNTEIYKTKKLNENLCKIPPNISNQI